MRVFPSPKNSIKWGPGVVLNGITDNFGIPEIPKIPKCTTFSVKKSKKFLDFFFDIQFSSQNSVFLLSILKIPKNTKQIPKKFQKFLEKQNF